MRTAVENLCWLFVVAQCGQHVSGADSCGPPQSNLQGFHVSGQLQQFTNSIGMQLIYCPANSFRMGSLARDQQANQDEKPQRDVSLTSGFWLGKNEVTQRQWKQVMDTEPWNGREFTKAGDDYPATYLNWNDAVEFCKRLSKSEAKKYRLPTEAEWEYACRAGTTTSFSFGDDWTVLTDYGWFAGLAIVGDNEAFAHLVGQKRPNSWGFHDMHGNVQEWCYDVYLEAVPGGRNPRVDIGGSSRVLRGGSWNSGKGASGASFCRSASRHNLVPEYSSDTIGFRVACDSDQQ